MKLIISAMSSILWCSAALADPEVLDELPEFVLWDSVSIEAAADRLEHSLGDRHMVYESLGNYDGHSFYLVLRGRTGKAEYHITESDIQIGVRGRATFVIGGELDDPVHGARRQISATSITGGKSFRLEPGDMVHVPPSTPHQLLVDPSEPYMYVLIKLDEEPFE